MNNEIFFTDVIKDVIGTDPVLDQFDIYYEASFYGTMQDDYITGSLVTESKTARNTKVYSAGERGRAFSKYYANTQPPLESSFGSSAVSRNPSLAFRLVPNSSRVSRSAYRLTQCYDAQERYFDSCLPDLKKCFSTTSNQFWTTDAENKTAFSPVGNMQSGSTGFMFFNSYKTDRSDMGFDDDPVVNNHWTWSYPYENKYDPQTRIIKTNNSALGLTDVSLVASFGMFISDIEDWLEVFNIRDSKNQNLTGFYPILPGFLEKEELPPDARNSLRSRFIPKIEDFDLLSQTNRIPASYSSNLLDNSFGMSMLIPGDVDLSKKDPHDWMANIGNITIPGPEYVTGTMTLDDTVKFLFGFGDLNNMTYGYRLFNSASSTQGYFQDFERSNPADTRKYLASDVPTVSSGYLTINWSNSPGITERPWQYVIRDGAALGYNYISASAPYVGMYWLDTAGTNEWVLLSNTTSSYGGSMQNAFPDNYSLCCVDITSSVPWSLKYKRGIVSDKTSVFTSYFSGIPGYPSHELPLGALQVVVPLDVMTGSLQTTKYDILSEYNSQTDGTFDTSSGKDVAGTSLFPFPPGEWRLNFSFYHTQYVDILGMPDIAAIKDFEITTYGPECFPPDQTKQMIGGNNYPQFRKTLVDPRYNRTLKIYGVTNFQVTGSSDIYKSFVFGVSPVIRGWKYGLFNGFPTHSKAVFKRNSYGQFRDMLEQRQYTKFINVSSSPVDNDAIVNDPNLNFSNSKLSAGGQLDQSDSSAVVAVNFVRQRYRKDDKGIGYIYNEKISPESTYSQNLSTEVTSSVPYFDGVARHRQESDLKLITNATITSLQFGSNGLTVS